MYKYNNNNNTSVCKCFGKNNSQQSIKPHGKFTNKISKNSFTQTDTEAMCQDHKQQITQLLTEVAISLRQKAKLEQQIVKMKDHILEMEKKHNEVKEKYEKERNKLTDDNSKTRAELSSMKITNLGEQKDLLNEISNLKTQIQELNKEKIKIYHEHQNERETLKQELNSNINELNKEVKINNSLKLKVTKYRAKFKNFLNYIQNLLEESKENKNEPLSIHNTLQNPQLKTAIGINMEDLILTELFFKPQSIPNEIEDALFNQQLPF